MISPQDLQAFWLTLQLATLSTLVLFVLGTPLAWWMARSRWRYKAILEALVALPLVLPPTVLGFYLLLLLGSQGPVGRWMQLFGGDGLAFTFAGLVVGSVVYSLPFVVQPLQSAFTTLGEAPLEAAATLRAGPWDRFVSVVLPYTKHAFLTAGVLGFAHTLGEFGVVLMIGGNIPGETRVVSIAVYEHVETLEYSRAHGLAALLLIISFIMLLVVYMVNRSRRVMPL